MKVLGFVFGKKALSRKGKLKPGTHNNGQMEKNTMILRRNMKAGAMILGICFLVFKHSGLAAL